MATRNMLIIRNPNGEIIGAQVERSIENGITSLILPAKPEQTLHRVLEVPVEICDLVHPVEFQQAIHNYVNAGNRKLVAIDPEEIFGTVPQEGYVKYPLK
jgi:hypothetical protein